MSTLSPTRLMMDGPFDVSRQILDWDDFVVDTLLAERWLTEVEADVTSPTTVAISEAQGGILRIDLGESADDFGVCAGPLIYPSGVVAAFDARIKVVGSPDQIAIGFSDAKTESNGTLGSNLADANSPTIVPADFVGFLFDSATGGNFWVVAASKNGTDSAFKHSAGPSTSYQKLSWLVMADLSVRFYIDDVLIHQTVPAAVRAGILLTPIIASRNVGAVAGAEIHVDYIQWSFTR